MLHHQKLKKVHQHIIIFENYSLLIIELFSYPSPVLRRIYAGACANITLIYPLKFKIVAAEEKNPMKNISIAKRGNSTI
jgi:hypothetical protein